MKRFLTIIAVSILLGCVVWIVRELSLNLVPDVDPVRSIPATLTLLPPTPTPFQPLTDTPTPTLTSSVTSTATPSPTSTITQTPTPSKTSTASLTPSPTLTPTPLKKAQIDNIRGRWPAYSLSCEASSAVDWAAYFGVPINEITFFNALPVSDNPNRGFVGDVHAPWGQVPPNPYGVYAGPVARILRSYGLDAQARYQMSLDELRAEISASRPVIVWVVGRVGEGTPVAYTSSDGETTTVARFEHTVIVIGYNQKSVTVLDGYWEYTRQVQDFLNSWAVLGNMAIVLAEP